MERHFEVRKQERSAECQVDPRVFRGMAERLSRFAQPSMECLRAAAEQPHAKQYAGGLMSDLKRKNVESIADRHDEDRRNLQHFIGLAKWDVRS